MSITDNDGNENLPAQGEIILTFNASITVKGNVLTFATDATAKIDITDIHGEELVNFFAALLHIAGVQTPLRHEEDEDVECEENDDL